MMRTSKPGGGVGGAGGNLSDRIDDGGFIGFCDRRILTPYLIPDWSTHGNNHKRQATGSARHFYMLTYTHLLVSFSLHTPGIVSNMT